MLDQTALYHNLELPPVPLPEQELPLEWEQPLEQVPLPDLPLVLVLLEQPILREPLVLVLLEQPILREPLVLVLLEQPILREPLVPLVLVVCPLVLGRHYRQLLRCRRLLLVYLEQLVLLPLNFSLLTHPLVLYWLQTLHFLLMLVVVELTQMRLLVMIPSLLLLTFFLQ
jgi:hypothetical protein